MLAGASDAGAFAGGGSRGEAARHRRCQVLRHVAPPVKHTHRRYAAVVAVLRAPL